MENIYKFLPFLVQHLVEVAQNYRDGIFLDTNDAVGKITGHRHSRSRKLSPNHAVFV
jgi:NAD(P)H dehydrogenase (quinone)